jgi:hypothetical protein
MTDSATQARRVPPWAYLLNVLGFIFAGVSGWFKAEDASGWWLLMIPAVLMFGAFAVVRDRAKDRSSADR